MKRMCQKPLLPSFLGKFASFSAFGGTQMGENYISCQEKFGTINISEEVITSLVRTAVTEVDGVSGLSSTAGAELAERVGLKTVPKGIKVQLLEGTIMVDTIIIVSYGCNIVTVARNVQEKVQELLASMTGIEKVQVNVHVSGVAFDK